MLYRFSLSREADSRKKKPAFPIGRLENSRRLRDPSPLQMMGSRANFRIFDRDTVDNHLQSIIVFGCKEKEEEHPPSSSLNGIASYWESSR